MLNTIKIRSYEMGLHFRDGEFKGLLGAGCHWFFDPLGKVKVEVVSQRSPWLAHEKLDMIVKSGALKDRAVVLDLKDYERALVWVDGRFSHILPPCLYAYWTTLREVTVELIDAHRVRFEHKDLQVIVRSAMADRLLDAFAVEQGHVGVLFEDGRYVETLPPGKYAFWKNMAKVMLVPVDLRETMLDIGGQEIMTADKVTLRLNAVATYRVADAHKALSAADDVRQALYREAQLALRAVIGGRPDESRRQTLARADPGRTIFRLRAAWKLGHWAQPNLRLGFCTVSNSARSRLICLTVDCKALRTFSGKSARTTPLPPTSPSRTVARSLYQRLQALAISSICNRAAATVGGRAGRRPP
jgi:hypothetical protein